MKIFLGTKQDCERLQYNVASESPKAPKSASKGALNL